MRRRISSWMLCFSLGGAAALLAQDADVVLGFRGETFPAAPPGAFVGGFAVLRSGNWAVYDGNRIVELDPVDGSVIRTILSTAGPRFGSFLEQHPVRNELWFGESSFGTISSVDLDTGVRARVARCVFPFALAFDAEGRPYVSWSSGFGLGSAVSRIAPDGRLVDVLVSDQAAGAITFDARGDLLYAEPDPGFPPPPDSTRLLRFTLSQLDEAMAFRPLRPEDGELVALLDGAFDIAEDESGDLFVTDSLLQRLVEIDVETGAERILVDGQFFHGFSYLHFVPGETNPFEWFQPGEAGQLLFVSTDFSTYNEIFRLTPRRPALLTSPAATIAPGPFELKLDAGVRQGVAVLYFSSGLSAEEIAYPNPSWPAPLWLGLDFGAGVLFSDPLVTDNFGDLTLPLVNPGLGGAALAMQAKVGATASGPFYGTSNPLLLQLD